MNKFNTFDTLIILFYGMINEMEIIIFTFDFYAVKNIIASFYHSECLQRKESLIFSHLGNFEHFCYIWFIFKHLKFILEHLDPFGRLQQVGLTALSKLMAIRSLKQQALYKE